MLEQIRAWLNGSRDYFKGVALYMEANKNVAILEVLQLGPNEYRKKRLYKELHDIYEQLKTSCANKLANNANELALQVKANATNQSNNNELPNADLYEVARHEADIAYKKVMNARAVLFSLAKCEAWEDPNLPDKINQRAPLAIEVVTAYQKASDLYDRANFVNAYGYLPDQDHTGQQEYTHLQDHLVKLRLDNARKALNKLKAKETTAERIALIQKHEANIRVLEEKWKALKITYEK